MNRLFSSESVTEGHPDKIADSISDLVLDALLAEDPASRVAVETMLTTGMVMVAGEITTEAYADIAAIARQRLVEIGYDSSDAGFDGRSCGVMIAVGSQSPDIAMGVNQAWETRVEADPDELSQQGAGDQGMMFGYACTETESLMPLPIELAHRLVERLALVRKTGEANFLYPDGKAQVSVRYEQPGQPLGLDTVVISAQHHRDVDLDRVLRPAIKDLVIKPVLAEYGLADEEPAMLINPTGSFVIGGPKGDAGLTGRKIIVDTYGGAARHGGGAFSGKDPSKVDRTAAYAMRWVAKNVVAAGLATRCEVQVAYAIGKAHPVGFYLDTFGTAKVPEQQIREAVLATFDLRPGAIVRDLDLLRPIYAQFAAYGHFGRNLAAATWETTNKAEALAAAVRG